MALKITDDCTSCDACLPECPNEAITEGDDIYIIDPKLCTECVGFFDAPQCAEVCPVDCCEQDEDIVESKEALIDKVKSIHPDKDFSGDVPSHV
ncbi:MAG: YfhL family 4Fe-4S dicluster ferredoxin [Bdellovibrionaceae bacterium]|nr:YfhL family 4Fe-4S dicluster ferredoxin [Pseudobdellovibrionaceae bacterium]